MDARKLNQIFNEKLDAMIRERVERVLAEKQLISQADAAKYIAREEVPDIVEALIASAVGISVEAMTSDAREPATSPAPIITPPPTRAPQKQLAATAPAPARAPAKAPPAPKVEASTQAQRDNGADQQRRYRRRKKKKERITELQPDNTYLFEKMTEEEIDAVLTQLEAQAALPPAPAPAPVKAAPAKAASVAKAAPPPPAPVQADVSDDTYEPAVDLKDV